MKKYDILYNSYKSTDFEMYQLASGHISTTILFFEKENVYAEIEACGHVSFKDHSDQILATGDVKKPTNGKGLYTEGRCKIEDNKIILQFPVYVWIDNYPNCDGEYDRWDTKVIGYHTLRYDLSTKEITIELIK